MERESFVFYRSFYEAAERLSDPTKRLDLYEAVIRYALDGEAGTADETILMALELCKNTIDKNNRRYENAKKGGRPKNEDEPPDEEKTDFQKFWKIYPRKECKKASMAAFEKCDADLEDLISAVEQAITTDEWKKEDGHYIPRAYNFLKKEIWTQYQL